MKLFIFIAKYFNFYSPLVFVIKYKGISQLTNKFNSYSDRKILLVSKTGFSEDCKIIAEHKENVFQFYSIDRTFIDQIARFFLPVDQRQEFLKKEDYNESAQKDLQEFWKILFFKLNKFYHFSCLLSGSWLYWNERDLHKSLFLSNFPVVIFYKEALASKIVFDYLVNKTLETESCKADLILTYSETQRQRLLDGGVSSPDKVVAVGAPRFDKLIHQSVSSDVCAVAPKIVFFLHNDFLVPSDSESNLKFREIFTSVRLDMIKIARELAQENSHIDVIVKTKVSPDVIEQVLILEKSEDKISNLSFLYGDTATSVLKDASITVVFNSTALLDSLAAGVNAVLFRPKFDIDYEDAVVDFGSTIRVFTSKEDLKQFLTSKKNYLIPDHASRNTSYGSLLQTLVGNSDGKAAQRAILQLNRILK
jgi:hypothetical protein